MYFVACVSVGEVGECVVSGVIGIYVVVCVWLSVGVRIDKKAWRCS